MDALDLLKEDHQKVKELFEAVEETDDEAEKKRIFAEIQSELETHARIEETVFYPAMEKHEEVEGHGARIHRGAQADQDAA
jgi:hemerythrin superfamily protein